jgi:hypothetical protein
MKKLLTIVVVLLGFAGMALAEGEPGGHGICKTVGKILICPLM